MTVTTKLGSSGSASFTRIAAHTPCLHPVSGSTAEGVDLSGVVLGGLAAVAVAVVLAVPDVLALAVPVPETVTVVEPAPFPVADAVAVPGLGVAGLAAPEAPAGFDGAGS